MINFWEPWCGPCVGEMPELEQMYQNRGGELLILGVYWTEDGAAEVLSETGITYPVILFDSVFQRTVNIDMILSDCTALTPQIIKVVIELLELKRKIRTGLKNAAGIRRRQEK